MNKKKNYLIVALVIILLALAVGYAAFSQTLQISGTATATGNWDVVFESASISPEGHGDEPVVSDDTITVNNLTLGYPGDGCTLTVNIKNNGNLAAKLTSLTVYNEDGMTPFDNEDITISVPSDIEGETLDAQEKCTSNITIQWNQDSTSESASASFVIKFEYEQLNTNSTTLTPSHEEHV